MRRILSLIFCCAWPAFATAAIAGESKTLIEACVRGYAMTGWAGEHLHVRVQRNGRVDYADMRGKLGDRDVVRSARLSPPQLRSLKAFLNSSEVRSLAAKFIPPGYCIDCSEITTISIFHGDGKPQRIELQDYAIGAAEDKKFYPQALNELICRLEKLRVKAALRLVHKQWCTSTR